jgi:hypothetical protein
MTAPSVLRSLYHWHTFPNVGDPRAGYRLFVAREAPARFYRFGRGEHRLADCASLALQLTKAQYPSNSISAEEALERYLRMLTKSREAELRMPRRNVVRCPPSASSSDVP